MKHIIVCLMFITAPLIARLQVSELPSVCDNQYNLEIRKVLGQAKGFASKNDLRDFNQYMILLKRFEDLLFKTHEFETNISAITTPVLAMLRTPSTKYNACRDQRVLYPSITALQCDQTYKHYMEEALKELSLSHDKNVVEGYKRFMTQVKHLEDARFKIHAFEAANKLNYVSTLRAPLTNYLGCRDLITRVKARASYPLQPAIIR